MVWIKTRSRNSFLPLLSRALLYRATTTVVAMAANDDRSGHLPDEILLIIFSLLPIKSIARAGAVCKRWNCLFHNLHLHPLMLDLGQHIFSSGISPYELVGSVDLCLRLLRGSKLKGFKLVFCPSIDHMLDLSSCLQRLVEKDVEQLELDFCLDYGPVMIRDEFSEAERKRFKLPSCLFGSKTITHFRLSRSEFTIPSDFSGFTLLTELRLVNVNITDEMLERMVATCPSMEILYLMGCSQLNNVRICGTGLQLKSLDIMDVYAAELEIDAPNLWTFHFNGDSDFNIVNVSSLVDTIVCAVPSDIYSYNSNWFDILYKFGHLEVLTLCGKIIEDMFCEEDIEREILPIEFGNLYELQILLFEGLQDELLIGFYHFFRHCIFPSLEKLFIELEPLRLNHPMAEGTCESDPPGQVLYNLRMVKINGFHGYRNEIMLIEFFLQRAVALDFLVLVAPAQDAKSVASLQTCLCSVLEQLSHFPKASSEAQILLYDYINDDNFAPTHTKSQYAPYYIELPVCIHSQLF